MAEHDPQTLADFHEARLRAHLALKRTELRTRLGVYQPAAASWVRKHPAASLAIAAGGGLLLTPTMKRRAGKGSISGQVVKVLKATKVMLYGRLVKALSEAVTAPRAPAVDSPLRVAPDRSQ